jgi:hypothetical protein
MIRQLSTVTLNIKQLADLFMAGVQSAKYLAGALPEETIQNSLEKSLFDVLNTSKLGIKSITMEQVQEELSQ